MIKECPECGNFFFNAKLERFSFKDNASWLNCPVCGIGQHQDNWKEYSISMITKFVIGFFVAIRNGFVIVIFIAMQSFSQGNVSTGQNESLVGMPVGVKIFDIGFRKTDYLNVASCRKSLYIFIRWSQGTFAERIVNFQIRTGVPRTMLPNKVGLYRFDSLDVRIIDGLNFTTPRDVAAGEKFFLLSTGFFSYVVQVYALDKNGAIVQKSQILYVSQMER